MVRELRDDRGRRWEVILGRESWGAFYALFVPGSGGRREVRRALLREDSQQAASRALMRMDEDALLALLRSSEPGHDGPGNESPRTGR